MKKNIVFITALASLLAGAFLILGGICATLYTYQSVAAEKITTPKDATIPEAPVRGPITLKVQADTIRMHTMKTTEGKTFAEMPRMIPKLDEAGQPVLDEKGEPVMVQNEKRFGSWIPAVTLMTALQLGVLSYAFSALAIALGALFLLNGCALLAIRRALPVV
ncbi:MAG TPA: hypothetical protein VLB83_05485 [Candidatus Paceibacterota bacterium]|nr:hypothetical protein [Candidatus Paceibacterota bacterium]